MSTGSSTERPGSPDRDVCPDTSPPFRRRKRRVQYTKQVSVKLNDQQHGWLKELADLEECSIGEVARELIAEHAQDAVYASRKRARRRGRGDST